MKFSHLLTGRLSRWLLLPALLLACAVSHSEELHPTGGYYLKNYILLGFTGCPDDGSRQSVTLGNVTIGDLCSLPVAAQVCANATVPGLTNKHYSWVETGQTEYGSNATDDWEHLTIPTYVCRYVSTNGATYTKTFSRQVDDCPSLDAPIAGGSFPHFTCTCPGEVVNGKCMPPPGPCDNAPEHLTGDPSVPAYQYGGGGMVPVDPNAYCTSHPDTCQQFSSWCEMGVDVPDIPTRGCDYTPTSWTRVQLGIIDSSWHTVYTKTGTDCLGSESGSPVETPPPDNDGDGVPDASDPDDDNDNIPDVSDTDPLGDGGTPPTDSDNDGTPDSTDTDDDGDGVPDVDDPDHPDYTGGGGGTGGGDGGGGTGGGDGGGGTGGGGGGTCDPATETCGGGCDPASAEGCGDNFSGGGFYSASYSNGISGVYTDKKDELDNLPFMASVTNTFSVDFGGTCPTWAIPAFGTSYAVDIQCDPAFDWVWVMLSALILASASLVAIRIALE